MYVTLFNPTSYGVSRIPRGFILADVESSDHRHTLILHGGRGSVSAWANVLSLLSCPVRPGWLSVDSVRLLQPSLAVASLFGELARISGIPSRRIEWCVLCIDVDSENIVQRIWMSSWYLSPNR